MSDEQSPPLAQLAERLAAEGASPEVLQLTMDLLEAYAQLAMMREVLQGLPEALHQITDQLRLIVKEQRKSSRERKSIIDLMNNLDLVLTSVAELARKHVTGLYDLERAIYGGETRRERERREKAMREE